MTNLVNTAIETTLVKMWSTIEQTDNISICDPDIEVETLHKIVGVTVIGEWLLISLQSHCLFVNDTLPFCGCDFLVVLPYIIVVQLVSQRHHLSSKQVDGKVGDGGASWRRRAENLQRQKAAGDNPTVNVQMDDMRSYIEELKKNAFGKSWTKKGWRFCQALDVLLFHCYHLLI